ncbi:hypothetical protein OG889_39155 [Streptomyces sp. NBC_00481]|nr:hypothetical protein [Streptomyces sp. NBC_00481]WRZ00193.1 hypothetical protein OG889_39155 [Streptomyces sp. NBC_00481]
MPLLTHGGTHRYRVCDDRANRVTTTGVNTAYAYGEWGRQIRD